MFYRTFQSGYSVMLMVHGPISQNGVSYLMMHHHPRDLDQLNHSNRLDAQRDIATAYNSLYKLDYGYHNQSHVFKKIFQIVHYQL